MFCAHLRDLVHLRAVFYVHLIFHLDEILINKCKMHIMLKLFPDIINGVGAKSCFQNSYSRTNYKF